MTIEELKRQMRAFMVLILAGTCSAATVTLTLAALTISSPGVVPDLLAIA